MGILGKLFDKKICDICGGEIGLMGNRKLEDGNLCKECAQKLSPWMTDRRRSTVEDIRQHLAYRAANEKQLANIHPTLVLGTGTKVYIDEAAGKFFVTRFSNWRDRNPDIIGVNQVIDVKTEVEEHRSEEYHRDRDGRQVSFNPPRYNYSYEFTTTILVDSPYFGEISFELTDQRPDDIRGEAYLHFEEMAEALHCALMPAYAAARAASQQNAINNLAAAVTAAAEKSIQKQVEKQPEKAPEPKETAQSTLMKFAKDADIADDGKWTCACGAVNEGKFCTNCGAKKPEPAKTFRCNKCGWTPEDPTKPPKFCPQCGDPFNEADAK